MCFTSFKDQFNPRKKKVQLGLGLGEKSVESAKL